ncbi:MAG: hypothetical protein ACT4OZ_16005 [Gemmatimonadota bacterium]
MSAFVVSGCGASGAGAAADTPEGVVERFYRAFDKGDQDAALKYFSTEMAGLFGLSEVKEAMTRDYPAVTCRGQLASISVSPLQRDSSSADFAVTMACKDGSTAKGHGQLRMEQGQWRVWEW